MSKRGSVEVAALLRQEISRGIFMAQDRLPPERKLREIYQVARGTIRGALNQLASEGLVEIRPNSGTYVKAINSEAIISVVENARPLELIDARFALEPHVCRLAVIYARQEDLERAEDLLIKMDQCIDDPIRFSTLDTAFHTLLAEVTGNRLLIWIIAQISSVRNQEQWAQMRRLTLDKETISNYNAHHRDILNAIRAREPESAALIMKEHLESARLSLTRLASI